MTDPIRVPLDVAVITVSRADWGPLRPVAAALRDDPRTRLTLIATGGHYDQPQGNTSAAIETDGFAIDHAVPLTAPHPAPHPPPDNAHDMPRQTAEALAALASVIQAISPAGIVILGDRYETLAAATAAATLRIPICHIHGGEVTRGALDDRFRNAISMLADIHCAATPGAAKRLRDMHIPPESIAVTGAPGLDTLEPLTTAERTSQLLVTVHPETRTNGLDLDQLIAALDKTAAPCLITAANTDPGGDAINAAWQTALSTRPHWRFEKNLGVTTYREAMATSAAMVGNSSSGIIEAASFGLNVVNIGARQEGRERSTNVLDAPWNTAAITAAIRRASQARYDGPNVYGEGNAAPRIVDAITRCVGILSA